MAGRVVRPLLDGLVEPTGRAEWDGLDRQGRPVPAGVYFVRLEAGDVGRTLRVVRLP